MRKPHLIALVVLLCAGALAPAIHSQNSDAEILVPGDPPLTSLMAGKVIVLLDWALELKLSKDQELEIKQHLVNSWRTRNRPEITGALEIIATYEKVSRMSETEKSAVRGKLHDQLLQGIRSETNDPLAKMLIQAYDAARGKVDATQASTGARIGARVGSDSVTGIYRMIRPRAININNTGYEPGYVVEYITFLPNGNVYWTLPPEGLLYFDPAVAQRAHPDDWGTYQIKNGEIHILRGPQRLPYVITRSGDRLNNPPSLGKGSFRPIPQADGLRLAGSYRRGEGEPTITFTTDGRFNDGGIFRHFGTGQRPDGSIYQDDGRGGSGTYLIEQNTLELRYSDGRIKRAPFIAFPENLSKAPAVESFILRWEETMRRL